jgi:hypothetical protein
MGRVQVCGPVVRNIRARALFITILSAVHNLQQRPNSPSVSFSVLQELPRCKKTHSPSYFSGVKAAFFPLNQPNVHMCLLCIFGVIHVQQKPFGVQLNRPPPFMQDVYYRADACFLQAEGQYVLPCLGILPSIHSRQVICKNQNPSCL